MSRFLVYIDGKFLTQVIEERTRGDLHLNLMVTTEEKLLRDMKVGCSDHEIIELKIEEGTR